MSKSYHRRVEFIEVLPLRLILLHHVDLLVLEVPAIPDLGKHALGIGAKGAICASE